MALCQSRSSFQGTHALSGRKRTSLRIRQVTSFDPSAVSKGDCRRYSAMRDKKLSKVGSPFRWPKASHANCIGRRVLWAKKPYPAIALIGFFNRKKKGSPGDSERNPV